MPDAASPKQKGRGTGLGPSGIVFAPNLEVETNRELNLAVGTEPDRLRDGAVENAPAPRRRCREWRAGLCAVGLRGALAGARQRVGKRRRRKSKVVHVEQIEDLEPKLAVRADAGSDALGDDQVELTET